MRWENIRQPRLTELQRGNPDREEAQFVKNAKRQPQPKTARTKPPRAAPSTRPRAAVRPSTRPAREPYARHFRARVENGDDGIMLVNSDGTVQAINRAALDWLGRTAAEVVGQPLGRFLAERKKGLARSLAVVHVVRSGPMSPPPPLSTGAQARLNQLLDIAPNAIIELDEDQRILTFNRGAGRIFGYRAEEVLGQPLDLLLPSRFVEAHRRHIHDFAAAPEVTRYMNLRPEVWGRRKDGTEFPAQVSLSKLTEQGQTFFLAILQDITERKRRESALTAIAEVGSLVTAGGDFQTTLETLARKVAEVTGFEGVHIDLYDAEKQEQTFQAIFTTRPMRLLEQLRVTTTPLSESPVLQQLLRTKQYVLSEDFPNDPRARPDDRELARQDGVQMGIALPLLYGGELIGRLDLVSTRRRTFSPEDLSLLSALANQTAEVVQNARLHEETRLYKDAFGSTAEGVTITDLEGHILDVNPAFERITGYSRAEALGQKLSLVKSQHSTPEFYREMWKQILSHGFWSGEIINRRKDGQEWDSLLTISTVKDERGQPVAYVGINRDITGLKELQREREAILTVATALRAAPTRAEMLPVILDQTMELLQADSAALAMGDPATGEAVVELGRGEGERFTGLRLPAGEGVSGIVIATGQPYLNNDLRNEPRLARYFQDTIKRATASVPLFAQKQIIGALWIGRQTDITGDELRLLTAVADIAANAIHRATLHEQTEERARIFVALNETARDLSDKWELEPLLQIVTERAAQLLNAPTCRIFLYDPDENVLVPAAEKGTRFPAETRLQMGESGVGEVAVTLKPFICPDCRLYPNLSPKCAALGCSAAVEVPMLYAGQLVGVVSVSEIGDTTRRFTEVDAHFLSLFAAQVAGAVRNARLYQETRRSLERMEALHAIDNAISSSLDRQVTLSVLLDQTTRQLQVNAAAILLLDTSGTYLQFAAGRGFRSRAIERTRVRVGEGLAGRAALERKLVCVPDLAADSAFVRAELFKGERFASYVAAPLVVKGQVKGVLEVFHRQRLEPSDDWKRFFEALATEAAIALDNAQLFEDLQHANLELTAAYDATIEGWSRALDLRDKETEGHTQRVTEMTLRLARAMGIADAELAQIRRGALLHDIGKMGVPDAILLKPDRLTDEEWDVMCRHPVYAHQMLAPIHYLQTRARHSVLPSRKMGRHRLSARAKGRSDSAGGAPLCGGGCVGRAALGPPVSERVGRGARARVHSGAGGQAFRPAGGEGVFGNRGGGIDPQGFENPAGLGAGMMHCPLCGFEYDAREAKCAPQCPLFDECDFICCPNCGYTEVDPARAASVRILRKLLGKKENRKSESQDPKSKIPNLKSAI